MMVCFLFCNPQHTIPIYIPYPYTHHTHQIPSVSPAVRQARMLPYHLHPRIRTSRYSQIRMPTSILSRYSHRLTYMRKAFPRAGAGRRQSNVPIAVAAQAFLSVGGNEKRVPAWIRPPLEHINKLNEVHRRLLYGCAKESRGTAT